LRTGDLGFVRRGQLFVTGRLKDLIIIRGRNYYPEDIEVTFDRADPSFRAGHGVAFSVEIKEQERLVVVQEIEPRVRSLDSQAAFQAIRQAISTVHELEVYSIVLAKAGAIPKTTSGKRRRAACRDVFLQVNSISTPAGPPKSATDALIRSFPDIQNLWAGPRRMKSSAGWLSELLRDYPSRPRRFNCRNRLRSLAWVRSMRWKSPPTWSGGFNGS
jgi:hypothetical protein